MFLYVLSTESWFSEYVKVVVVDIELYLDIEILPTSSSDLVWLDRIMSDTEDWLIVLCLLP